MYFKNSSSSNSIVLFTAQQHQQQISNMLQNTWYWSNGFTHFALQDSSRYFFWSTGSSSALNILRKIMSGNLKKKNNNTHANMHAELWCTDKNTGCMMWYDIIRGITLQQSFPLIPHKMKNKFIITKHQKKFMVISRDKAYFQEHDTKLVHQSNGSIRV